MHLHWLFRYLIQIEHFCMRMLSTYLSIKQMMHVSNEATLLHENLHLSIDKKRLVLHRIVLQSMVQIQQIHLAQSYNYNQVMYKVHDHDQSTLLKHVL